jgi:hypothetical protein
MAESGPTHTVRRHQDCTATYLFRPIRSVQEVPMSEEGGTELRLDAEHELPLSVGGRQVKTLALQVANS